MDQSKEGDVDYYYKAVGSGHQMQWDFNLMHGKPGPIAYDLDGVLCFDWDNHQDYEEFLKTVKPYRIPVYPIDCIITARKQKYRGITEAWLKAHNVKYGKLYMMPDNCEDHIKFKTGVLIKEKPAVYVESEPSFARKLHRKTWCTVVCTGDVV